MVVYTLVNKMGIEKNLRCIIINSVPYFEPLAPCTVHCALIILFYFILFYFFLVILLTPVYYFKLRIFRVLSKYLKILYQVLIRDLIPFLLVSLAVTFVFTGAFYFALREEILVSMLSDPSSNVTTLGNSSLSDQLNTNQTTELRTSLDINPEETGYSMSIINFPHPYFYMYTYNFVTACINPCMHIHVFILVIPCLCRTYPRVFLTGVRLIIEGQNFLTYFGISGYRLVYNVVFVPIL